MTERRQFLLVADQIPAPGSSANRPAEQADPLPVPGGVSYLNLAASGEARLQSDEPAEAETSFLIEPCLDKRPPLLIVISPHGKRIRVNGQEGPQLSVLFEKDQWQPDGRHLFHVTLLYRPYVGEVAAEFLGKECPVCRVPFSAGTRVYACPVCGTPLHLQTEESVGTGPLECAAVVSECPVCQSRIELAEGITYQPELYLSE